MPTSRAFSGLAADAPHHQPHAGAGEERTEQQHQHGDDDEHAPVATLHEQLGAGGPRPVEQRREEAAFEHVGEQQRDEQQHLGDADGRHQHDEAGRVGQAPDHGPLGE